jgi:hypothetical protein
MPPAIWAAGGTDQVLAQREVVSEAKSIVPDFAAESLNDRELEDLLAYLETLVK